MADVQRLRVAEILNDGSFSFLQAVDELGKQTPHFHFRTIPRKGDYLQLLEKEYYEVIAVLIVGKSRKDQLNDVYATATVFVKRLGHFSEYKSTITGQPSE